MQLGDVVRDRVSGFQGVAVCRSEWLNGCVRWSVQPQALHEGKPIESQYIDEEQLEVVDAPKLNFVSRRTGGDRPDPVRPADDKR
jgi:hypothetical protein